MLPVPFQLKVGANPSAKYEFYNQKFNFSFGCHMLCSDFWMYSNNKSQYSNKR